jgi:hypothetical protein
MHGVASVVVLLIILCVGKRRRKTGEPKKSRV